MAENRTRRQITYVYDDAGNLTSENRSGADIDKKSELFAVTTMELTSL